MDRNFREPAMSCSVILRRIPSSKLSRYYERNKLHLGSPAVNGSGGQRRSGMRGANSSTTMSGITKRSYRRMACKEGPFDLVDLSTSLRDGFSENFTTSAETSKSASTKRKALNDISSLHSVSQRLPIKRVKKMKASTALETRATIKQEDATKAPVDHSNDSESSAKSPDSSGSNYARRTPERKAKNEAQIKITQELVSSDEDCMSDTRTSRRKVSKKKLQRWNKTINQVPAENESEEYSSSPGSLSEYDSSADESVNSGSASSLWDPKRKTQKILRKTRGRLVKERSTTCNEGFCQESTPIACSSKTQGAVERAVQKKPPIIDLSSSLEDEVRRYNGKVTKKKRIVYQKKYSQAKVMDVSSDSSEPLFIPVRVTLQSVKQEPIEMTPSDIAMEEVGVTLRSISLSATDSLLDTAPNEVQSTVRDSDRSSVDLLVDEMTDLQLLFDGELSWPENLSSEVDEETLSGLLDHLPDFLSFIDTQAESGEGGAGIGNGI